MSDQPVHAPEPAPDPAPDPEDGADAALLAVLVELDRHVAADGWEQPARLFALVPTVELIRAEPGLAATLSPDEEGAGAEAVDPLRLTPVEQDEFSAGDDLVDDLAAIAWPAQVQGCAVSAVRSFLPASLQDEIPDEGAAAFVAAHPQRQDVRVVVGVDRAGHRHGVARLASHPDELLSGRDLVPGLLSALAHTLN